MKHLCIIVLFFLHAGYTNAQTYTCLDGVGFYVTGLTDDQIVQNNLSMSIGTVTPSSIPGNAASTLLSANYYWSFYNGNNAITYSTSSNPNITWIGECNSSGKVIVSVVATYLPWGDPDPVNITYQCTLDVYIQKVDPPVITAFGDYAVIPCYDNAPLTFEVPYQPCALNYVWRFFALDGVTEITSWTYSSLSGNGRVVQVFPDELNSVYIKAYAYTSVGYFATCLSPYLVQRQCPQNITYNTATTITNALPTHTAVSDLIVIQPPAPSSIKVYNGQEVHMKSAGVIQIYPGFETESNCLFRAFIASCPVSDCEAYHAMIQQTDTVQTVTLPFNNTSEIRLWPNPADEFIVIQANEAYDGKTTCTIFDILGNIVWVSENEFVGGKSEIPVKQIATGVYRLKLEHKQIHTNIPFIKN